MKCSKKNFVASDVTQKLQSSKGKSRESIKFLHRHRGNENRSGKKQIVPN